MIFTQMSVSLLYQYWIHTELIDKMPRWFEAVFNTPSHHRVHHGSNAQYIDKNYAGIFIVWDRLFGSFEPEVEKVVYGVTTPIETVNPIKIFCFGYINLFKKMSSANSFKAAMGYFFKPPGWQPQEK